jgi:DNA-binding response OmpR family regulator
MAVGKVLVVEEDDGLRRVTQLHLDQCWFITSVAADAEQGLRILQESPHDLVLTALRLRGCPVWTC